MATIINELTENPAGVVYRPPRDWDAKTRLLSSIEKARRLLDYEPRVSFREGLERTHEWFRENWELIKGSAEF
jgi:UDP-glucose 4-epimerase